MSAHNHDECHLNYCGTCNNTGYVDCYCGGDICVCGGQTGGGENACDNCNDGEVFS